MIRINGRCYTSAKHAAQLAGIDLGDFVGMMHLEPTSGVRFTGSWGVDPSDEVAVAVDRLPDLLAAAGADPRLAARIAAESPATSWCGKAYRLDETPPEPKRGPKLGHWRKSEL